MAKKQKSSLQSAKKGVVNKVSSSETPVKKGKKDVQKEKKDLKTFKTLAKSVKGKMSKTLAKDKVQKMTGKKKKPVRKPTLKNRLRYKGKLIPINLEEQIRECYKHWRKKKGKSKRVTYEDIINAFYENKNKAIADLDNYTADPFCGIDELESGIYEFHYFFMNKLREMVELYQIKTPKYNVMRWGDDFYQRVSRGELRAELDDFTDTLYKAYAEARRNGESPESPQWQFEMAILIYSGEIFVDFNKTDIDDTLIPYLI